MFEVPHRRFAPHRKLGICFAVPPEGLFYE
jgi:hypothetical protein